jgi:hypothetical protein
MTMLFAPVHESAFWAKAEVPLHLTDTFAL